MQRQNTQADNSTGDLNAKFQAAVTGTFQNFIETDKAGYSCLVLSQHHLAIAKRNAKINVYTMSQSLQPKLIYTILGHSMPVYNMIIFADLLITAESTEDALLKIWQLKGGSSVRALKGHSNAITCISAYSHNLIASASQDCSIIVWELSSAEQTITILKHDYPMLVVKMITKQVLVGGGDDCLLTVWRWQQNQKLHTILSHINSLSFIVEIGSELVTGGGDGTLKFYKKADLLDDSEDPIKQTAQLELSILSLNHVSSYEDTLLVSDMNSNIYIVKPKVRSFTKVKIDIAYYEQIVGVALLTPTRFYTVDSSARHWTMQIKEGINIISPESHHQLLMEQL